MTALYVYYIDGLIVCVLTDVASFVVLQIVGNADILDSWRQLALEVLVGLAENAPAMVRKLGSKFLNVLSKC